jgi:hypothetical protein
LDTREDGAFVELKGQQDLYLQLDAKVRKGLLGLDSRALLVLKQELVQQVFLVIRDRKDIVSLQEKQALQV